MQFESVLAQMLSPELFNIIYRSYYNGAILSIDDLKYCHLRLLQQYYRPLKAIIKSLAERNVRPLLRPLQL